MKSFLPIAGLVAGLLTGFALFNEFHWQVPLEFAPYLSIAALAGIDTVFGGIRAGIEGRFQNDIFASGFVLNAVLAVGLTWFGTQVGADLGLVAILVLGARIFNNLSLMRRFYLNKIALVRKRLQEDSAASFATMSGPTSPLG